MLSTKSREKFGIVFTTKKTFEVSEKSEKILSFSNILLLGINVDYWFPWNNFHPIDFIRQSRHEIVFVYIHVMFWKFCCLGRWSGFTFHHYASRASMEQVKIIRSILVCTYIRLNESRDIIRLQKCSIAHYTLVLQQVNVRRIVHQKNTHHVTTAYPVLWFSARWKNRLHNMASISVSMLFRRFHIFVFHKFFLTAGFISYAHIT